MQTSCWFRFNGATLIPILLCAYEWKLQNSMSEAQQVVSHAPENVCPRRVSPSLPNNACNVPLRLHSRGATCFPIMS